MQENPLVSIICMAYNHENFVVETLNSVIQHILDADDFTMRAFLIKELPERLQKALDTQMSSSRLIDLLKYESEDADAS